jgi:hypothetical protein
MCTQRTAAALKTIYTAVAHICFIKRILFFGIAKINSIISTSLYTLTREIIHVDEVITNYLILFQATHFLFHFYTQIYAS